MGAKRGSGPRRRVGGLIVVSVVAVAAVALVLWVVLGDNKTELLAPPVDTTPQLSPEALAVQFDAAVVVTAPAEDAFVASQAAASAACSCAAGEQDPQMFAHDAQGMLPSLQQQEQMLVDLIPAAAADIAEHMQVVLDLNRRLQSDLTQLQEHSGDTDTGKLTKARIDLLNHLVARNAAIQVVQNDLGSGSEGQPTTPGSPDSSTP